MVVEVGQPHTNASLSAVKYVKDHACQRCFPFGHDFKVIPLLWRLVYDFHPCLAGFESHFRKIKCKLKEEDKCPVLPHLPLSLGNCMAHPSALVGKRSAG